MIAINIPEGVYTMKTKMSIIKENAKIYSKASKKQKKEILDDLVPTLHLYRKQETRSNLYILHLSRISFSISTHCFCTTWEEMGGKRSGYNHNTSFRSSI